MIRFRMQLILASLMLGSGFPARAEGPAMEIAGATAAVTIPSADPFTRGVACREKGDTLRAIEEFQKAASLNPGDPSTHLNLGILYGEAGKLDDALMSFDRALAINPGMAAAQFNRGVIFMRQGKQGQAISAFEKSLILGGDNPAAHYNLAVCYEYMNGVRYGPGFNAGKSIAHYLKVLEKQEGVAAAHYNLGMVYLHAGNGAEAEKSLRKATELDPEMADAFAQLGRLLLAEGQYHGAMRNLREARRLDSNLPLAIPLADACGALGQFYLDHGDLEQACRYLEQAVEYDPSRIRALISLARVYDMSGRYAEAIECFTRAASLDANLPLTSEIADTYMHWGDALADEGLFARAVAEYERARQVDPLDAACCLKLARLYHRSLNNTGKAIYYYRRALANGLPIADAEEARRALSDAAVGDDRLLDEYRALVARNPDQATLRYNLGVLYHQRKDLDKAIEEYTHAVRLDPPNGFAHYNLGLAYQQKGMRSAALREYRLALRHQPRYCRAGYALGRLYEEWGAYDKAKEVYEKVIREAPEYADAHLALGLLLRDRLRDRKGGGEHLERYRGLTAPKKENAAPAAMP